jgi:uncharacterized RDD family membrane protein YckC
LSKSSSQPANTISWKQEINQRLAEHKDRRGLSVALPETTHLSRYGADSPAAQAAARVAERYAKAPSYNEMLAEEARASVRAAEAASQAALKAQNAAESLLAGIEAANEQLLWEPAPVLTAAIEPPIAPESKTVAKMVQPTTQPATESKEKPALGTLREIEATEQEEPERQEIAVVEPDRPIHANLIEFPRQLVATRKVRPRLAEESRSLTSSATRQLSIFEVDPETISIEPVLAIAMEQPSAPIWSDLQLEAQPVVESQSEAEPMPELHLARMNRRSLAALVDGALIVGTTLSIALMAASHVHTQMSAKQFELSGFLMLAVIGVLYQVLSFTLSNATPGMKYARISLCTFTDEMPTPVHLRSRLIALLLSVAPVGLGVVWILFDDDHLSWHDRISRTYQREC